MKEESLKTKKKHGSVIFECFFLRGIWLYKNLLQKCIFFRQMEILEILNGFGEPLVMPLLHWVIIGLDLQGTP